MTQALHAGDTAPDFTLLDDHNRRVTLSDYRGKPVVVYFYPKAETPGCTTEACDFRDNIAAFTAKGYQVLGISSDDSDALAGFRDNHGLSFPLLSDADQSVIQSWGAWGEKTINGNTFDGTLRSTVVLDEDGVVQKAHYNVAADGHVASLRSELGLD